MVKTERLPILFLPYFPRQIRLSYPADEICKLIIRVKYPKDSCNQNGFHAACSLLLFLSFSKEEKETARPKQFSPN